MYTVYKHLYRKRYPDNWEQIASFDTFAKARDFCIDYVNKKRGNSAIYSESNGFLSPGYFGTADSDTWVCKIEEE